MTEIPDSAKLMDEIYRFSPSEIICNEAFYMSGMDLDGMKDRLGITIYSLDSWYFDDDVCRQKLLEHFKVSSFAGLGLADYDCGVISAGALLAVSSGDTEELSVQPDSYHALCVGKIHDAGQLYETKSGTVRDAPGEAEERLSSLGAG